MEVWRIRSVVSQFKPPINIFLFKQAISKSDQPDEASMNAIKETMKNALDKINNDRTVLEGSRTAL